MSDTTSTKLEVIQRLPGKKLSVGFPASPRRWHRSINASGLDDLATAKSKVKGETVSNEAAKKQGEEWAARAGSQIDRTVSHEMLHFILSSKASYFLLWETSVTDKHISQYRSMTLAQRPVKPTRSFQTRPPTQKIRCLSSSPTVSPSLIKRARTLAGK